MQHEHVAGQVKEAVVTECREDHRDTYGPDEDGCDSFEIHSDWLSRNKKVIVSNMLELCVHKQYCSVYLDAGLAVKYLVMNGARAGTRHARNTATLAARICANRRSASLNEFQIRFALSLKKLFKNKLKLLNAERS